MSTFLHRPPRRPPFHPATRSDHRCARRCLIQPTRRHSRTTTDGSHTSGECRTFPQPDNVSRQRVSAQRRKSSFSRFSSSIRCFVVSAACWSVLLRHRAAPAPVIGFSQNGQADKLAVALCQCWLLLCSSSACVLMVWLASATATSASPAPPVITPAQPAATVHADTCCAI